MAHVPQEMKEHESLQYQKLIVENTLMKSLLNLSQGWLFFFFFLFLINQFLLFSCIFSFSNKDASACESYKDLFEQCAALFRELSPLASTSNSPSEVSRVCYENLQKAGFSPPSDFQEDFSQAIDSQEPFSYSETETTVLIERPGSKNSGSRKGGETGGAPAPAKEEASPSFMSSSNPFYSPSQSSSPPDPKQSHNPFLPANQPAVPQPNPQQPILSNQGQDMPYQGQGMPYQGQGIPYQGQGMPYQGQGPAPGNPQFSPQGGPFPPQGAVSSQFPPYPQGSGFPSSGFPLASPPPSSSPPPPSTAPSFAPSPAPSSAAAPPSSAPQPSALGEGQGGKLREAREKYREELKQLRDMGLSDEMKNLQALQDFHGEMDTVVAFLISNQSWLGQ